MRRLRSSELTHGEATFRVEGPVTYRIPRPPPSAVSEWEPATIELYACGHGSGWVLVAHVVSSRSDQWHEFVVHEGEGHPGWLMITRQRAGFSVFGARLEGRGGAPLLGWMTFAVAFELDPMIDGLRRARLDQVPDEVERRFVLDEW